MVGAAKPRTFDGDGLHRMDRAAYSSGRGSSGGPAPSSVVRAQPSTTVAYAAGRLLLLTGDLAAYSSARRAWSSATFAELFSDASWVRAAAVDTSV